MLNSNDVFKSKMIKIKKDLDLCNDDLLYIDNKLKSLTDKISIDGSHNEDHPASLNLSFKEKSFLLDISEFFYNMYTYLQVLLDDKADMDYLKNEIDSIKLNYSFSYTNLFSKGNDVFYASLCRKLVKRVRYNINLTIALIYFNSTMKNNGDVADEAMVFSKMNLLHSKLISGIKNIKNTLDDVDVIK